ncbi:FecR family protein [Sphingobacterium bovistauri]|uniref:FecR family protein n=1 Tax=Sphingobacterium bovistauri TaxID=2781959 RepID=A0ABS7Z671_9SPHI|nr:FecR family protein [Sphingobacterium bovistauri]MCA5005691.1 FecR family protein [Sphingobacterium bovistauri]
MKFDKDILKKYSKGLCTHEERALVEKWFEENDFNTFSDDEVNNTISSLDKRFYKTFHTPIRNIQRWKWLSAVAVLLIGFGVFLYNKESLDLSNTNHIVKAPTSSNARIVLNNNTEISIDDIQLGDTVAADGYYITKLEDGSLKYLQRSNSDIVVFNTLITKPGGSAKITLSDGTKLWANANSIIEYPITFQDNFREVRMTGEAYFEVAHVANNNNNNNKVPFFVRTDQHTVQVHGTKFNVNTYSKFEAALLEGKISIAKPSRMGEMALLADAIYMNTSEIFVDGMVKKSTNITSKIDWVNGYFDFTGLSLQEIAVKLSNWYDVDVKFGKGVREIIFYGEINRTKSLNQVLDLLSEVEHIKYTIEGKNILIESK